MAASTTPVNPSCFIAPNIFSNDVFKLSDNGRRYNGIHLPVGLNSLEYLDDLRFTMMAQTTGRHALTTVNTFGIVDIRTSMLIARDASTGQASLQGTGM